MYNFKTLFCYNCKSVLLNLPEVEISKLNGLNFVCECCGHRNLLTKNQFSKSVDAYDPYISIQSVDNIISERALYY
ncbi:MAG: hypothetical protein GX383_07500 [Clostridium sp.]|jgi:transcription elongation factor Elf1|nr:hypothetical protein [Clostridium sp.]